MQNIYHENIQVNNSLKKDFFGFSFENVLREIPGKDSSRHIYTYCLRNSIAGKQNCERFG